MKQPAELEKYGIQRGLDGARPMPIVMTDYMDTIVKRSLSLGGVLTKWAAEMGRRFGIDRRFLRTYRYSVAEGIMHNIVPAEVVYSELADHCVHFNLLDADRRQAFCDEAHRAELHIELDVQTLIPQTEGFLRAAKESGSRIACVTDLRFSGEDVRQMLEAHGLLDLFDWVISSADEGNTKAQGDLYDHALAIVGANPSDCLMIGDGLHSDCVNAAKHGIKACWVA
jgi:FMN phosphatase YigB (HAD superfamily)